VVELIDDYETAMRDRWTGPAVAPTVGLLRAAVTEFAARAGVSDELLADVRACVSEAATNAVVHAFRDGQPPGTIVMSAEIDDENMAVVVSDDGVGFLPRKDSPGLGLGIPTIAALSTSMSLGTPAEGGTEMRMVFALDRLG
jgi:serine/threonine-protein kinase RsbW/stage II sporulation protein AB (anti-sigma F factor)